MLDRAFYTHGFEPRMRERGVDRSLLNAAMSSSPWTRRTQTGSHQLATAARSVIARHLTEIVQLIDHETGPAPIAFDPKWQQRRTELTMSILQSHG